MDRNVSFSVKPDDRVTITQIEQIKAYCKKTDTRFSYLMCQAVAHIYKELKL